MHEPTRRRTPSPWVWAVVGVLVLTALTASSLHFVTAACAARLPQAAGPPLAAPASGRAFFYDPGPGPGSCSLGPLPVAGFYVSLAAPQYAGGAACGTYVEVSGPAGRVRAEVVDLCPGCANGGIDLSEAAFARVADPAAGTAVVSYRLARDPRLPGPVELRIGSSASAGWLAVQVINHGNPLASVQVAPPLNAKARTGWRSLRLRSDDYWVSGSGAGPGPFRIKITDIYGHQVVARGVRLTPGAVQRTSLYMYRPGPAAQPQLATTGPPPPPVSRQAGTASPAPAPAPATAAAASPHC